MLIPGNSVLDIVFLAEAFDAAGSVNEFLLACKERMAGRTNFNLYVFYRRTCFYDITACAVDFGHFILGMYLGFH